MENLAAKYRPRVLDDVVEQDVVVNIVRNICKSDDITNRNFLFIGPAGCGKAQPLDSKVLTSSGFKLMKDILIGDEVVTHTGQVGHVVGIFPQGCRPVYRLTLADRAYIDVADNHLNLVEHSGNLITLTTDFLMNGVPHSKLTDYSVPIANISQWLNKLGYVDPYRTSVDRSIIDIHFLEHAECQCIYIDHPDHTYVSDNFVPTHNTTTARIIANAINDNKGEPIEIDAASHSGVDAMREIIAQMQTYPVGSKYKVFIIDECHALSQASWQALLKSLEEQPARTIVNLCTTNPEKIPATILSRVQTFQLSKISLQGIHDRLEYILKEEGYTKIE